MQHCIFVTSPYDWYALKRPRRGWNILEHRWLGVASSRKCYGLINTIVSHLIQNLQQGCSNFPKCRGYLKTLAARRWYEAGSILTTWKYYAPPYKIQLCGWPGTWNLCTYALYSVHIEVVKFHVRDVHCSRFPVS